MGTVGTSISSSSGPSSRISSDGGGVGGLIYPGSGIPAEIPSSQSEILLSYRRSHNLYSSSGGGGKGIGIMETLMTNVTTITNGLSGDGGSGRGFSDFGGGIDTTDFDHHYNSSNNIDFSSVMLTTTTSTTAPMAALDSADDLFRDYDFALTQLAAVFCVIFIVLGVPGNLITIIALARCKKVSQLYSNYVSICTEQKKGAKYIIVHRNFIRISGENGNNKKLPNILCEFSCFMKLCQDSMFS